MFTFHIFDFEQNLPKLERKQELYVLYQVCVFRADQKYEMANPASGRRWHFRLLWNRWPEFAETWEKARTQRPLPSLCFRADRKNKIDWSSIFDFSESAERNLPKLDGKQELNVLYQVCVFVLTEN